MIMEGFQIRAIEYHAKDLESKALITSHVLKVLPRNTRADIEKIKEQGRKLRKFLEALKKTKDGFNLLLRGLTKEKHHNEHLVEKLQQKAKECLKAELNNKKQNIPSAENQISQTDMSTVFADLSKAAIGKCHIPPDEVTVQSFAHVVDELNKCRGLLPGKGGKTTGNDSLSSLITSRDQNQRNELEKCHDERQREINQLREKLELEKNKNQSLLAEKDEIKVQNERKINERVREIMRKRLLAPPGQDGDFTMDSNLEDSTDTESDDDNDDGISDASTSTDDRIEKGIDLDNFDESYSVPNPKIKIKNFNIRARNVNVGDHPTITNIGEN